MTNDEAIIVLKNIAWFGKIYDQEQTEEAVDMAINALTAQPERIQNNAVHLCDSCQYTYVTCPSHGNDAVFGDGKGNDNICACNKYRPISAQPEPSQMARDIATIIENEKDMRVIAQPETHEERTETHACDCISRQAAIDFIDAGHLCNPNEPRWSDNEVVNFLKSRPSAQPEIIRCCKCGFWDRDTLRHQFNDFRDWNEAECMILAERDPYHEMDRYTEADDFCSRAERRTDGN